MEASKSVRIPRRLIFLDSEAHVHIPITDEEVQRVERSKKTREAVRKPHKLYIIGASFLHRDKDRNPVQQYKKRYVDGNISFNFWRDVDRFARMSTRTFVFAHNAKYDVQVTAGVKHLVADFGYEVTAYNDANPFFLILKRTYTHSPVNGKIYINDDGEEEPRIKTIYIVSSTNYFKSSLAKLGEVFKLPKLEFDHGTEIDMRKPAIRAKVFEYLDRDVEILETAMLSFIDFVEDENFGSFGLTIAAQAFGAFRRRFLGDKTIWIHNDEDALKMERDAYAGGRTECFRMGLIPERVFYVDVNSMYAHVMKNNLYPVKLITKWTTASINQIKELIQDNYLIVAECRINTALPVFHLKKERLIFPVGTYWTSLCTPEIIYALNHNLIEEVRLINVYEPDNIFEPFVDYNYGKRLEAKAAGDDVRALMYKDILTNLYGKFGQRGGNDEIVGDAPKDEVEAYQVWKREERKNEYYKVFGGHVWKKQDGDEAAEAFNSFPAIAAHVTAYARMLLLSYIEIAGWENVFYCDTDSIFTNEIGFNQLIKAGLINNDELGLLKLEDSGSLELFGCKDYVFISDMKYEKDKDGNKTDQFKKSTKIKGVNLKSARQLPNSPDGHLRFAVTQWGGFSDRFKDKSFMNYYNKVLIKELKREYTKGTVIDGHISPYVLNIDLEIKEQAAKEKTEYDAWLKKETNDLFNPNYLMTLCKLYGYLKAVYPHERYYGEYKLLGQGKQMNYFRRRGKPIDEWCDEAGMSVRELFDLIS